MNRRSFLAGVGAMQAFPAGPIRRAVAAPSAAVPSLEGNFVDLAAAQPQSTLTTIPKKGYWRKITWTARAGTGQSLSGTILSVGPETNAPPITIDQGLRGPHEVFVGLPTSILYENPNAIRIKLDNDPCYVPLAVDPVASRGGIQDCRFRAVDLTGRKIQIAGPDLVRTKAAAVAYIRAVPVPESQLDSRRSKGIRMVALNDGFSYLWERGVSAEDRLWEEILPYRDSGYNALQFCITGADHCNYPTKVGTLIGDGLEDYPRVGDRYYTECMKNFLTHGIDPVASTMKFTRSIGLEYHLSIRMEAFAAPPTMEYMFRSKFYAAHPELCCRDRDGRKIARMSYAFPEVREHIFTILEEMANYRPEGINFIFPRANPYLLYEEPFVQEFQKLHGTDPRKLPEFHPDVVALRCQVMGRFLSEARQRILAKAGRPIELSAIVLADRESNLNFGLDVAHWVQQGWLNEISPSVWAGDHHQVEPHMGYLVDACKSRRCRLVVNMLPRKYTPDEYIARASEYLSAGAEGFSMWDLNGHHHHPVEWNLLKAVGRLPMMPDAGRSLTASAVVMPFTELGGFAMDRYPALWAF
jgi:hypothetical protein